MLLTIRHELTIADFALNATSNILTKLDNFCFCFLANLNLVDLRQQQEKIYLITEEYDGETLSNNKADR